MSAASIMAMPAREAYPSDVVKGKGLSSSEKHVYKVLAEHVYHPKRGDTHQRPYDGIVWLRRATICEETSLSDSTVRRAINKLLAENWLCLPEGDAGGRSQAIKYHLHSDGCSCHLPKVPLKQREAEREKAPERASSCTPFEDPERASNYPPKGVTVTQKGVTVTGAYKEGTISTRTISLTTAEQAIAPETSETLVAAAAPLCGEKFSQASNQKNSSSQTTAVETITNHPTPYDPPPPLPSAALPEAVQACAAKIYQNHPPQRKDISLAKVGRRITEILRYRKLAGEPALAYLGVLADRHGAWCRYGEWKKENGRFAKGLNRWLAPGEELYEIDSPEQAIPATPEPRGLQIWEIK